MADVYVYLTDNPIHRTQELSDEVSVDYDEDGRIVGIEILGPTRIDINGTRFMPIDDEETS